MTKKQKILKPKKVLAKQAKKKGDKKSEKSLMDQMKEAEKITSAKVGPEMETELQRLEKKIAAWSKKGVEKDALQRFAGRVMKLIKELGIIVACDHAVFQKEVGLISLLEMDLVATLNESGPIDLEQARARANALFSLIVDSSVAERIERTWDGMAWRIRSETGLDTVQDAPTVNPSPNLDSSNKIKGTEWAKIRVIKTVFSSSSAKGEVSRRK